MDAFDESPVVTLLYGILGIITGLCALLFTYRMRKLLIGFRYPRWYRAVFGPAKSPFMRGPYYILTLRLSGLAFIVIGTVFVASFFAAP